MRDVVQTIVTKCVHPDTGLPYPVCAQQVQLLSFTSYIPTHQPTRGPYPHLLPTTQADVIEAALKDIHFSVKEKKSAKQQAMEAIQELAEVMPIVRKQARVRVRVHRALEAQVTTLLAQAEDTTVEHEIQQFWDTATSKPCHDESDTTLPMTTFTALVQPEVIRQLTDALQEAEAAAKEEGSAIAQVPTEVHVLDAAVSRVTATTAGFNNVDTMLSGATLGAAPASSHPAADSEAATAAAARPLAPAALVRPQSNAALTCRSCGGAAFENRDKHRAHFRSDWHRGNLKRKLKSLGPLSEAEWDALSEAEQQEIIHAE